MLRSEFLMEQHGDTIVIFDLDQPQKMSVTNDAENVVEFLFSLSHAQPWSKLIYSDSEGRYDQILVKDRKFVGFSSINTYELDEALDKVQASGSDGEIFTFMISHENKGPYGTPIKKYCDTLNHAKKVLR